MAHPVELAESAMMLWTQGLTFRAIADELKRLYGVSVSPGTISDWKRNGFPEDWEEFKAQYIARIRAKQIEELADYAIRARKHVFQSLSLVIATGVQELQKYLAGKSDVKVRSIEGIMRELREAARLYADLYGDPTKSVTALLEDLDEGQKLEVEAILAMSEGDKE